MAFQRPEAKSTLITTSDTQDQVTALPLTCWEDADYSFLLFVPGSSYLGWVESSHFKGYTKFQNSNFLKKSLFLHLKKEKENSSRNVGTICILINVSDDGFIMDSNSDGHENRVFYSENKWAVI